MAVATMKSLTSFISDYPKVCLRFLERKKYRPSGRKMKSKDEGGRMKDEVRQKAVGSRQKAAKTKAALYSLLPSPFCLLFYFRLPPSSFLLAFQRCYPFGDFALFVFCKFLCVRSHGRFKAVSFRIV